MDARTLAEAIRDVELAKAELRAAIERLMRVLRLADVLQ